MSGRCIVEYTHVCMQVRDSSNMWLVSFLYSSVCEGEQTTLVGLSILGANYSSLSSVPE